MSSAPYQPPSIYYNPNDYNSTGSLTIADLAGTYMFKSNPTYTGTLSGTTATITNITGTLATASQPNITSVGTLPTATITTLTSTNIGGTLTTAAQPNITSLGTLTGITCSGNISGTLTTAAQPNITSVGTLTSLVCSGNISGTILTANQPNITAVGTLPTATITTLSSTTVNSTTHNGTIFGTTTSSSDVSIKTNNTLAMTIKGATQYVGIGSGSAAVDREFAVINGTAGTTNPTIFVGTALSANNGISLTYNTSAGSGSGNNFLAFNPYGTSNALIVRADKRVGINTTTPTCPFEINDTVTLTLSSGGTGWSKLGGANGGTATGTADVTLVTTSMITSGSIKSGGAVYTVSDRRVKYEIEELTKDYIDDFYDIKPVSYRLKNDPDATYKSIGFISQDLITRGYSELLSLSPNESLKVEQEGDIDGIQIEISYDKICVLHHLKIQELIKTINEMKQDLKTLKERCPHEKAKDKKSNKKDRD